MAFTKLKQVLLLSLAMVAGSCQALQLHSQQAIVISSKTGSVLYEKNAISQVPIASLSKLMTAMTVLDSKPDMREKIEITAQDVDVIKHSRSYVPVGTMLERRQVLQLALMSSDNRAAAALARTYPGGNDGFSQALKQKLKNLDMTHTVIAEPTGLSPENTSTAADLAKMALAASHYPEIASITTDSSVPIKLNKRSVIFHNTNHLVGAKGWDILLSKTGFTNEAGHCLIMRVKHAGKDATLVLLNSKATASSRLDALNIRQFLSSQRDEQNRIATMHRGAHRTAS